MNDKRPGDNKPKDDGKKDGRRKGVHPLVASQFAYTLVIATVLMGFIGHWLGEKLGGSPWTNILMFVLGGMGFAAEVYRMVKMFSPGKDDEDGGDPGDKSGDPPHSSGTTSGGTHPVVDRLPDGPEDGDIERPGDDDRRGGDDIERPGDDDRRGGDDIERPGEADDRPFADSGDPYDGLTAEEIAEIEKLIAMNPDGSPLDGDNGDSTPGSDSAPDQNGAGKDKKNNNNGSNE